MKHDQCSKLVILALPVSLAGCAGAFNSAQGPEFKNPGALPMAAVTVNPNAIFVATDGNVSNQGSMAQPLRTIARALANSGGDGIDVADQAEYVQTINNIVHDSQTQGMAIGGKYHRIQNNDVHYNSATNKGNANIGWDQGLSIIGDNTDSHIMVIGNRVHENWGEGIGVAIVNEGNRN